MSGLESTLAHRAGEIPHGYAGRLASSISIPVGLFCTEVGISMPHLVAGMPRAIDRLVGVSGADRGQIERATIAGKHGRWMFGGQALDGSALSRARLRVCPHCIVPDVIDLPPIRRAGIVQAAWLVAPIRTCPIHEVALVDVPPHREGTMNSLDIHDMPSRTAAILRDPARFQSMAVSRPTNALERYLLARLAGASAGPTWLDGLAFFVAARLCEMLGAFAIHGRDHDLDVSAERGWHEVGDAGFGIASGGVASIRRFLDDVRRRSASPMQGAQATYGRLYKWLAFGAECADFDPVRRFMHEHIVETMPSGKGDVVLGIEVAERRIHSIRTASLETGLHPKRLRRLLANAGHLPVGHRTLPNNLVLFDARTPSQLLEAARDQVSLTEAETYLNAPRVQAKLLSTSGLISPIVSTEGLRTSMYAFARSDLDEFLRQLLSRAVEVVEIAEGRANIPMAAKRANCSAAEIVRLILSGQLAWVGRHAGQSGYMAIIVDVAEVKELTRGKAVSGHTLAQVRQRLKCSDTVVTALIHAKILPSHSVRNPINRCPMPVVSEADLARFDSTYVSLFRLANELGLHFKSVQTRLKAAGVSPAFDREKVRSTFYRRSETLDALS